MNTTYSKLYKNEPVQLQYFYDPMAYQHSGGDSPAGTPNYTPGVDANTDQDVINPFEFKLSIYWIARFDNLLSSSGVSLEM